MRRGRLASQGDAGWKCEWRRLPGGDLLPRKPGSWGSGWKGVASERRGAAFEGVAHSATHPGGSFSALARPGFFSPSAFWRISFFLKKEDESSPKPRWRFRLCARASSGSAQLRRFPPRPHKQGHYCVSLMDRFLLILRAIWRRPPCPTGLSSFFPPGSDRYLVGLRALRPLSGALASKPGGQGSSGSSPPRPVRRTPADLSHSLGCSPLACAPLGAAFLRGWSGFWGDLGAREDSTPSGALTLALGWGIPLWRGGGFVQAARSPLLWPAD